MIGCEATEVSKADVTPAQNIDEFINAFMSFLFFCKRNDAPEA